MSGYWRSEGNYKFALRSCHSSSSSSRPKKRFKPIQFSSGSSRWVESKTSRQEEEEEEKVENDDVEEEIWCNLPDELVAEVFEWLPIKSIVKFRLVSKSCSALFKTPTFIENHRIKQHQRSNCGTMLLLRRRCIHPYNYHDVVSFHDLDSPVLELRDQIPLYSLLKIQAGECYTEPKVLGHNNGIIGILINDCALFLSNPALRECKLLPPILWPAPPHGCFAHICTSGFSVSSSEDFKVILFCRFINEFQNTLMPYVVTNIYNSRSNSWRRFDDSPMVPDISVRADGIITNGAWHWFGFTLSPFKHKVIVSVNVTSEVFGQLELPPCVGESDGGFTHPIVLNNCLGVVHYRQPFSDLEPGEVWVMKEYGVKQSWNKLFVIGPQPFAITFLPGKNDTIYLIQQAARAILSRTGKYVSESNDQLASINLHTSEVTKFPVVGTRGTFFGVIYEESLVSLN